MALIDNKITDGDISTYGVVSAPDRLTGTANENKQVFDNLIKQAVKVKMNELINDLIAATAAGELGAKAPSGLSGSNIQTVLQSLKTYVDNTKVAKEPGKGLSENDYTDSDKALVGQIPNKADKTYVDNTKVAKVPGKELSSNDYTDEDKALVAQIPEKAGVDNVLTKDNVTPFEPTGEYNPCTKKYADNLAFQSGNVTSVFGRGGAVVAQDGDYTPQQVGAEPAFSVLPVSKGGTGNTSGAAAKLTTKRTIALSGGATGTATGFDGSGNISIPVTALDMSKATAGTLPVARGGSGLTAAPSLLVNLASTTAAGIFTASPRPGVTGTLPVARGGTGATSLGSITVGNSSKWGSYSIWKGTQAQYNALTSKSSTTLYFIVG